MNKRALRFKRFWPPLAVILVSGLFGHSIGVVGKLEPGPLALGAMVIAAIAYGISRAFRPFADRAEETQTPLAGRGLRLATYGFLTAAAGWLVVAYISAYAGTALVFVGIAVGIVGIVLGQFGMFTKR